MVGHRAEPAQLEHVRHALAPFALAAATSWKTEEVGREPAAASAPLERGEHVVRDREPAVRLDPLERAAQPGARPAQPADHA